MPSAQRPVVQLKRGSLRGNELTTPNGITYYNFLGIPYAKPPVGELRFKDPVAHEGWDGERDASKEGGSSAQFDLLTHIYSGEDDCLYLNVNTCHLKDSPKQPLPVIVWIHGGGFVAGSGNMYKFGPVFLIEHDVIVVSINYRLGVIGFLCTDPVNARGNMGLKDQNLALRWVRENIEEFGGDPNNITLLGLSAGSASVEYHILSEMSKDLFHKAIMMSGSVFNPWAVVGDPVNLSRRLAISLGFPSENKEDLFDFINSFDTKTLVNAAKVLLNDKDLNEGILCPFVPTTKEFPSNNMFLKDLPEKLYETGAFNKVPTISGFCDKEGIFAKLMYMTGKNVIDFDNENYLDFIPTNLKKDFNGQNDRLKKVYAKNLKEKNDENHIIDLTGDIAFHGGIWKSLKMRCIQNYNKNYFYCFAYDGGFNFYKKKLGVDLKGACHADDIGYIGTREDLPVRSTVQDESLRLKMVQMWTDFAKYGNPTPKSKEWSPVENGVFKYLEIGEHMKMQTEFGSPRFNLWNEIYNGYKSK